MIKIKHIVVLVAIIGTSTLFAGDKVVIGAYNNYPTASCKIGEKYYLIPNGTVGEVFKWNSVYTDGKDKGLYAQLDMLSESEVTLSNGPQKGKSCFINHIYIQMK